MCLLSLGIHHCHLHVFNLVLLLENLFSSYFNDEDLQNKICNLKNWSLMFLYAPQTKFGGI